MQPAGREPPPPALVDQLLSETRQRDDWVVVTDRTFSEERPVFAVAVPVMTGGAVVARVDGAVVSELFKDDGSMHKMIVYPQAGYWVSYSRTAGENPLVRRGHAADVKYISISSEVVRWRAHLTLMIPQKDPFERIHLTNP